MDGAVDGCSMNGMYAMLAAHSNSSLCPSRSDSAPLTNGLAAATPLYARAADYASPVRLPSSSPSLGSAPPSLSSPSPSPSPDPSPVPLSVVDELVSGSVSAIVSRLLISPLDVVKIRMQLCTDRRPASLLLTVRTMLAAEGLSSLWKGNVAAELMVVPYGAVSFLAYSSSKRALQSFSSSSSVSSLVSPYVPLLAGSASGVCATLATYPLDLLRTRFVAQRSSAPLLYGSLRQAVTDILATDGLRGLYRGLWPTLVGIVPLMALQFQTYETAKRAMAHYNSARARPAQSQQLRPSSSSSSTSLTAVQQSGCGFIAGVVSKWLTMPLDVIKKRCQVLHFIDLQQLTDSSSYGSGVANRAGRASGGVLSMGRSIVRAEGVAGLFKGSVASLLKAGPNAALIYVVYEQCRAVLSCRHQPSGGSSSS